MATVYLARDAKHDRQVALKVLDPELGAVIGAERFLSEIRVTANLQHPNLLPLFDSGEAHGLLFYVMPFVGGESLRSRIQREKQLPLDDAIRISVAVASAVDYAHRHGIVHRDLKPENVLLHDGEPMVADFGIALAVSNAGGSRITQTGISLGTPQYMSPEQATGDRAIDGRTDIYSLAAMTYEMLAGEPPHNAPTAQAVIAKLMTEEPRPVSALRRATPTYVDEALQRALEKLPADRFGTAREFADALQGKGAAPVLRAGAGLAGRPSRWNSLTVVACTVAVLATSAAFWAWTRAPRETDSFAYRVPLAFPSDTRVNTSGPLTSFDISPDGKQLVYVGGSDRRLFIRRLDELTPRVLSDGPASSPHFSRDGRLVGFVIDYTLMKIPVTGGAAAKVADGVALFSWSQSGDVVFTARGGPRPELFRVREGGAVEHLTPPPQPNETVYGSPCFLPDGDAVLFTIVIAGRDSTEVAAIRLSDRKIVRLGVAGISPLFLTSGHLMSVGFNGELRLTPFDAKKLRVTGPSETVLQNVMSKSATVAEIAVSSSGTLVYLPGQAARQIVEFDRAGHPRVITPMSRDFRFPRYSPDGRRIAVTIGQPPSMDVWVYSIASGTLSRLTTDAHSTTPVWSPDGRRVAWTVSGGANAGTWWRSWDGSDAPTSLLPLSRGVVFSPKGDFFVANVGSPTVVTAVRLDSSRAQKEVVKAQAPNSAISPDGKWLAYVADETGSLEVYIRPFPGPGGHYPISNGGGFEPVWGRNGTEIFYRVASRLVVASIAVSPEPHVIRRDSLFALSAPFGLVAAQYDVSPDGQHILAPSSVADDSPPVMIINWVDELRRRTTTSKTP